MLEDNAPSSDPSSVSEVPADARFLNSKAWTLRWSDRKRSSELARQALKRSEKQCPHDGEGVALACRTLGWQAKWIGDFDTSLAYCRRAQEGLLPDRQAAALADVFSILGVIHYSRGRRDLAMSATQKGLTLIENVDAVSTRIDLLTTLGTIHRYNGRMFDAYKALQTARTLSERGERARVDHNLARCLEQDNSPSRAIGYAMRAVIGARRHGNRVILPYALEVLGIVLGRLENYDLAMTYLNEGLSLAAEDDDTRARCQLLEQIGHIYQKSGATDKALEALASGLELAKCLDYPVWQRKFLHRIAKIEQGRNNHAAAVEAFSKVVALMEAERA
ncbi:MAG: tetratricopeptide repeat protein [Arenibacterium sp.]